MLSKPKEDSREMSRSLCWVTGQIFAIVKIIQSKQYILWKEYIIETMNLFCLGSSGLDCEASSEDCVMLRYKVSSIKPMFFCMRETQNCIIVFMENLKMSGRQKINLDSCTSRINSFTQINAGLMMLIIGLFDC